MNGSLDSPLNYVDIKLKRGPAGLGFNIVGGVDQLYVVNDNGIYVAKIKEDGAAAQDGRLEEGDKILMINGNPLDNLTHKAAVDLFRMAGEDVELRVLKKSNRHMNGPTDPQPENQSSLPLVGFLLFGAAVALISVIIYKRLN
ncbi:synaptojanin-2-binding protein [Menidia menidia]|uniref:Synaptojanin-2-binding protein n=1 Tax=Menidia menidia TaxID=238744 RepID=A0A8S4AIB3_9TELE|nr:unnamed protein product [Menidia menidia]